MVVLFFRHFLTGNVKKLLVIIFSGKHELTNSRDCVLFFNTKTKKKIN